MGLVSTVVLPWFGSEPWFEPNFLRTGPGSSSKFSIEGEPNLWFGLRFEIRYIISNLFERVRTHYIYP